MDSELKERSSLKWFILAGLALFILFTRIHTYHEPLEPDITIYAVIAHELLDGRELYSDLWDHKPPAVYIFYAVAEVLAGYGPAAIFMLNVAIAIISLFGVYLAARTICVDPRGGLWAAAFWALLSDNIHMHANQPNTEVFINACMIWGFALLVQADNRMRIARYLGVGALLALASLFKQVVILGAVFFALAHFLFPAQSPANRKRATLQILCMALVGVVAWLAIFGYFALMGRFGAFWDAVFAYNQMYSGDMFSNLYNWIFNWGSPFPGFFKTILPFLVLTLLGLFFGISPPVRNMALFLGLLVSSMLAVALPGMNHPHYYQLLLPPLSVGAGLGVGLFYKRGARNYAWLVHCFGIFILAIMLLNKLPLYSMPGESWSRIKYGDLYIESYELGRDLDVILQPDETFYALGMEAELYFVSKRRPPSGVISSIALLPGPFQERLSERLLADLKRNPPEMFVITKRYYGQLPVLDWASSNYVMFPGISDRENFTLAFHRDGRIVKQLNETGNNP